MKRGVSLAETLVAASLGLLVLSLLSLCLVLSLRFWRRADQTQTAQQETLALQVRLQDDYSSSKFGSLQVQLTPAETRLAFLSYEGIGQEDTLWTAQGQVIWRKWIAYRYRRQPGTLERREFPLQEPSSKPDLTAPAWPAELPGTQLASHLTEFELVRARPDAPLLQVRYASLVGSARNQGQSQVLPRLYGPDME